MPGHILRSRKFLPEKIASHGDIVHHPRGVEHDPHPVNIKRHIFFNDSHPIYLPTRILNHRQNAIMPRGLRPMAIDGSLLAEFPTQATGASP